MYNPLRLSFLITVLSFWAINAATAENEPLVTVDIQSYEKLMADMTGFAATIGQEGTVAGLPIMLGTDLMKLVDPAAPWHAAVWMESLADAPIVAVVVPISDFEAFQAAVQMSMVGQMGASYYDAGDSVVFLASQTGVPVPDGWSDRALSYASELETSPKQTIELSFAMNEEVRQTAVAGLAASKNQMLVVFDTPDADTAGMDPEQMKAMMEAYFAFYESLLLDAAEFKLGVGVEEERLECSVSIEALEGSGLTDFIDSQDIDLTELASSVDWDSEIAMLMGMSDLPESWQPMLDSFMESMMPIYGLDRAVASEWVEVLEATLPFKGVFDMNFTDGMSFSGFYDILDAPASEVYDAMFKMTETMSSEDQAIEPYYSEVIIEKGVRSLNGHGVDRIELTLNPEHPALQMPEQKQAMEHFFKGGQIIYEMALVGNRIHMATEGELDLDPQRQGGGSAAVTITPNTRMVFSMDFGAIMRLGSKMSAEPMPASFATLEAGQSFVTYLVEIDDAITLRTAFPLSIFKTLSSAE